MEVPQHEIKMKISPITGSGVTSIFNLKITISQFFFYKIAIKAI